MEEIKYPGKKKFEYDILYIDKISLILDLKIFLLTILKVIKRKAINSKIIKMYNLLKAIINNSF